MGTEDEINRTQQAIKDALEKIGLKIDGFAGRYFDDTHPNSDDEAERVRFQDAFTKQLKRPTTSLGKLEGYLRFIYAMDEFKKAELVAPRDIIYPELNTDFRRGMRRISQSIDQALMHESDEHEDPANDT